MAQTSKTITDYLVELADDPARLDEYLEDPERALASAGLATEDRAALRSGDLLRVREAVTAASGGRDKPDGERNIVDEPEPDEPEPDEPPPPQS